jgi:hypothetical protein
MNRRFLASMMALAGLSLLGLGLVSGGGPQGQHGVFPPNSHPYGHSYAQWSARENQWGLPLPVGDCSVGGSPPGHPFLDCPNFDVTEGQAGKVWFLAGAFGTVTRTCTIPAGKALFVVLANSEASSLEDPPFHGDTAAEQSAAAQVASDHIVVGSLFCTIDGQPVTNLGAFRVQSPQITFTAPSPWIFGPTGGQGTSVADGYNVMLKPLHAGHHTLHFGGAFHYAIAEGDDFDADFGVDQTYILTQLGNPGDDDDD